LGDGCYAAFRFRTYSGAGALDHERRVLKIDYDWDENPRLLIRDILMSSCRSSPSYTSG
jgi:hypothetical protein